MRWKSTVLMFFVFIVFAGLLIAGPVLADEDVVTGTLIRTDEGIVLSADNGDRLSVSGRDVSNLVGKSVKATGIVVEDVSGININITSIEEIP